MPTPTTLELQVKTLPDKPGVYQYFDKNNVIIYVGKAKRLKRRVSSYFNKNHDDAKTRILVRKIVRIEHIVVDTETDALLLENNLIKKYQPKYNILLKDDKSYPWICIKKERYPRVFVTRKVIKDGSEYFGPYTNIKTINALLYLIDEIYSIRTYKYNVGNKKSNYENYIGSLEHQIKTLKTSNRKEQTEEQYMAEIAEVRSIIKGNFKESTKRLSELMQDYAVNMRFEEAHEIKTKLEALQNYQSRSTIVNPRITNVDVFSIISDESYGYANFFKIMNGSIIQAYTTEIKKKLNESDQELLQAFIFEMRERFTSLSREVYVPFDLELAPGIKVTVPKLGDKKHILDLSLRNAKYYRQEQFKQIKITDPSRHTNRIMRQMKKDLRLIAEPRHIECFDNSNIQGTNPVAACVVFKDGKPSKKDYRHFNIKTVVGPDDFSSMEEVVYRRYKRLLDQQDPLPQLIVIDGGKGQLSSALKSLDQLGLRGKIAIIGIAKRLEEIYFPEDSVPLYLDKRSESLKIIQYLRNEAHRFGITFHRNKRSKSAINSELENISGIGKQSTTDLLKHFKSVKRIKKASLEELKVIVGENRAKKIINHYREI